MPFFFWGKTKDPDLYKLSKKLGIIPKTLDKDQFMQRFFHLYIDRGENLGNYAEDLYDKDRSPGYKVQMENAFAFMFGALEKDRSKKLDINFINDLYAITSLSVSQAEDRSLRDAEAIVQSAMGVPDMTKEFFANLGRNNDEKYREVKFELLPQISAGAYARADESWSIGLFHKSLFEDPNLDHNLTVSDVMTGLLDAYNENMALLNKAPKKSSEQTNSQKLKLIASLVGDMMRLHPYFDGNGRTFTMLVLNYLLIQEKLTPCMLFNPWHAAHASVDDFVMAIREGQDAFQNHFIEGKRVDDLQPSTKELLKIQQSGIEYSEETSHKIIQLFGCYLKAESMSRFADDDNPDVKSYIEKLTGKMEELIKDLMGEKGIDNFNLFAVPNPTNLQKGMTYQQLREFVVIDNIKLESNIERLFDRYLPEFTKSQGAEPQREIVIFKDVVDFINSKCKPLIEAHKPNIDVKLGEKETTRLSYSSTQETHI